MRETDGMNLTAQKQQTPSVGDTVRSWQEQALHSALLQHLPLPCLRSLVD